VRALPERGACSSLPLLKNKFRAIGWDKEERAAAPISRGPTLVAMMQTADLGEGNNVAGGGKLHATRPWAVVCTENGCPARPHAGDWLRLPRWQRPPQRIGLAHSADQTTDFCADLGASRTA
jgi:hypothetical protein